MEEKIYYKAKFLGDNDKKGKSWLRDLAILLWAIGALVVGMAGCLPSGKLGQTITVTATATVPLDSDGDGIPDAKEMGYGTDPHVPNHLLAYALKVLPEVEALKFKEGELNENSRSLVDLYASLPQEKRDSREVNDVLTQILSDKEVDGSEKSLFDDRFVNPTLPSVDLSWVPTREKLDKVYDIEVTFVARDDKTPIAYAELRFVPVEYDYMIQKYGMRPEDYPKVFPPDKERVFVLKPVDGKFDSLEEKFSIAVTDIVGGREYKIVALVKDLAGNEKIVEVKTPYIRQFENVAKTDDILVGAYYYPWYGPGKVHWKEGYKGKPLLGEYYSGDEIIINKHIDWMTGYGIDFILPSWWGPQYEGYKGEPDRNFKNFLRSPLIKDIKFGMNYESLGRLKYVTQGGDIIIDTSDPQNIQQLVKDFDYLSDTYFDNPSILTINGKVVSFFYLSRCYTSNEAFHQLQAFMKKKGYELYIVGDEVYWQDPSISPWKERIKFYDAVTSYNMLEAPEKIVNFEALVDNKYKEWHNISKNVGVQFIADVLPGYDDRAARPYAQNPVLPKTPERFEKQLKIALKYSPKILLITTFNEWHEYTAIEPSVEHSFSYLEVLRDVLKSKSTK